MRNTHRAGLAVFLAGLAASAVAQTAWDMSGFDGVFSV
jgi:hypothetical protein